MKKANCINCGEGYSCKRKELGYETCLDCGRKVAAKEVLRKAKCIAPAFNKGAYVYISSKEAAKDAGK
jgi:hypothetical protein